MRSSDIQQLLESVRDPKCTNENRMKAMGKLKKAVLPTQSAEVFRRLIEAIFERPDQIENSAFVLYLICGDKSSGWQPYMMFAPPKNF